VQITGIRNKSDHGTAFDKAAVEEQSRDPSSFRAAIFERTVMFQSVLRNRKKPINRMGVPMWLLAQLMKK